MIRVVVLVKAPVIALFFVIEMRVNKDVDNGLGQVDNHAQTDHHGDESTADRIVHILPLVGHANGRGKHIE